MQAATEVVGMKTRRLITLIVVITSVALSPTTWAAGHGGGGGGGGGGFGGVDFTAVAAFVAAASAAMGFAVVAFMVASTAVGFAVASTAAGFTGVDFTEISFTMATSTTSFSSLAVSEARSLTIPIHTTDIIPTATIPTAITRMAIILTAMDMVVFAAAGFTAVTFAAAVFTGAALMAMALTAVARETTGDSNAAAYQSSAWYTEATSCCLLRWFTALALLTIATSAPAASWDDDSHFVSLGPRSGYYIVRPDSRLSHQLGVEAAPSADTADPFRHGYGADALAFHFNHAGVLSAPAAYIVQAKPNEFYTVRLGSLIPSRNTSRDVEAIFGRPQNIER